MVKIVEVDVLINQAGATGPAGADGVGVPTGGTTGQVLKKNSNINHDTVWQDETGGGGGSDENYTTAEKNKLASITAIFTTALETAYNSAVTWISTNGANLLNHIGLTNNPHGVTKAQVGLGNVDNTSDADKPISTATQTAINYVQDGVDLSVPKLDPAIAGATKTKVTYNFMGQITEGFDATTADITDSSNKRYVTDANLTLIGNTSGTNTGDNATNSQYSGLASSKQDTLVSASNIKTINGNTILGGGDLIVGGASNTYIQETDPLAVTPYIWFKTDTGGKVIDILKG